MRFSEIYNKLTIVECISILTEMWKTKFDARDFGDTVITRVPMPDEVLELTVPYIMETYTHDAKLVWTYVFDASKDPNDPTSLLIAITGSMKNPGDGVHLLANNKELQTATWKTSPYHPESIFNYSGVEPMYPPFIGYDGDTRIPKEFNMDGFSPIEDIVGIRTSEDYSVLNN